MLEGSRTEQETRIHVSTQFYPSAPILSNLGVAGDPPPADVLLISSDNVFFYVHTEVLLRESANGYGGLLSGTGAIDTSGAGNGDYMLGKVRGLGEDVLNDTFISPVESTRAGSEGFNFETPPLSLGGSSSGGSSKVEFVDGVSPVVKGNSNRKMPHKRRNTINSGSVYQRTNSNTSSGSVGVGVVPPTPPPSSVTSTSPSEANSPTSAAYMGPNITSLRHGRLQSHSHTVNPYPLPRTVSHQSQPHNTHIQPSSAYPNILAHLQPTSSTGSSSDCFGAAREVTRSGSRSDSSLPSTNATHNKPGRPHNPKSHSHSSTPSNSSEGDTKLVSVPLRSEVLNVLLHIVYLLDVTHYSPTLEILVEVIDVAPRFGYDVSRWMSVGGYLTANSNFEENVGMSFSGNNGFGNDGGGEIFGELGSLAGSNNFGLGGLGTPSAYANSPMDFIESPRPTSLGYRLSVPPPSIVPSVPSSSSTAAHSVQPYRNPFHNSTIKIPNLHTLLLTHAKSRPLDLYIFAATKGLDALAIAVSSNLCGMALHSLTDQQCGQMGAVYLKRLFFLHLGRVDALKVCCESRGNIIVLT